MIFLRSIWNFIKQWYNQTPPVYFWTPLWIAVGIFLEIYLIRQQDKVNQSSALIWALGFWILGGLTGFVFAVPKIIAKESVEKESIIKSLTLEQQTNFNNNIVQENNNLTDISDWLTKIVIGATLVQLKEIPGFVLKVAGKVARGIVINPNDLELARIFTAGIIVYSVPFGFASGYLIMKLILTRLFR